MSKTIRTPRTYRRCPTHDYILDKREIEMPINGRYTIVTEYTGQCCGYREVA